MDESKLPNEEEVAIMAKAAKDAAFKKAVELGYSDICGMLGIERAFEAVQHVVLIGNIIGPEGMTALWKALVKAEIHDMLEEAEEALREEN